MPERRWPESRSGSRPVADGPLELDRHRGNGGCGRRRGPFRVPLRSFLTRGSRIMSVWDNLIVGPYSRPASKARCLGVHSPMHLPLRRLRPRSRAAAAELLRARGVRVRVALPVPGTLVFIPARYRLSSCKGAFGSKREHARNGRRAGVIADLMFSAALREKQQPSYGRLSHCRRSGPVRCVKGVS